MDQPTEKASSTVASSEADDDALYSATTYSTTFASDAESLEVVRNLVKSHRPHAALEVLRSLKLQQHNGAAFPILESEVLLQLGNPEEALSALDKVTRDAATNELDDFSTWQWSRNKALAKLRVGRLLSAREDFKHAATLEAGIRKNMLKEVKSENKSAPALMLEACRLSLQKMRHQDSKSSDQPGQGTSSGQHRVKSGGNSWGVLQRTELQELRILMAMKAEERNAERCADIVQPLRFFKRFSIQQCADFLRDGDLVSFPAAAYIVQQGDPAGPMYVVISGVVCVEQTESSMGAEKVIMNTLYDGQVFGELSSMTGFEAKRTASVLAQEDTVLLCIDPAFYFRVITDQSGGGEQGERQDLLLKLPMFEGCKRLQLMSLAANLELVTYRYDECVLPAGQRPPRFLILTSGTVDLVVDKGGAYGEGLVLEGLRPGRTLGHGVLQEADGECKYISNVAVMVTSALATFFAMTRRSIFYLPDSVQNMILAKLPQLPDPICGDVKGLINHDKAWQRRKKSLFKEMERVGDAPPVLTRPRSASSSALFFCPMSPGQKRVAPNDSHTEMERIMRRLKDKGERRQVAQDTNDTLGFKLRRAPLRSLKHGTQSRPHLATEKSGVT
jgi:CRP-like cAMP-binding protein